MHSVVVFSVLTSCTLPDWGCVGQGEFHHRRSLPLVIVPGHSAVCGATVVSSLFHHRRSLPLVIVPGHSAGCGVTVISGLLSLYWNL